MAGDWTSAVSHQDKEIKIQTPKARPQEAKHGVQCDQSRRSPAKRPSRARPPSNQWSAGKQGGGLGIGRGDTRGKPAGGLESGAIGGGGVDGGGARGRQSSTLGGVAAGCEGCELRQLLEERVSWSISKEMESVVPPLEHEHHGSSIVSHRRAFGAGGVVNGQQERSKGWSWTMPGSRRHVRC